MSKIRKPADLVIIETLTALLYGQPGAGKSTLALTGPNPIYIDCDGSVNRLQAQHQVDTLQVTSYQDILDELNEGTFAPFGSLVIDTAGKLLDFMSDWLIQQDPKLRKGNGELTLQGYGARKAEFRNFLRRIAATGKHVFFVAHEKEEKDGETTYRRPEVGGSSGNDLFRDIQLIGYLEMIGNKRTVSFAPTAKYYAKNSIGMDAIIEIPVLTKGGPNSNFLKTQVIDVYRANLEARKEQVVAFNKLMNGYHEMIDPITTTKAMDEALKAINEFDGHIWASKLQAKQLLNDKAKALNFGFDKEKGVFVAKAAQPEAEKPAADQPAAPAAENAPQQPAAEETQQNTTTKNADANANEKPKRKAAGSRKPAAAKI